MKKRHEIPDCKVTLIGDSGVGKSSIIGRYVTGIFMENDSSTAGANFTQKTFEKDGKKVRLNIWDTAGQERYRALGQNFYKDSYIICIVYDVTSKQSFKNIKEMWHPDVLKYGEKYHIISIVGNKCDKYEMEEVTEEEAQSYAEEIKAKFFLVSALNGNGIDRMFQTLAEEFLNPEFKENINSERQLMNSFELNKDHFKKKKKNNNKCC